MPEGINRRTTPRDAVSHISEVQRDRGNFYMGLGVIVSGLAGVWFFSDDRNPLAAFAAGLGVASFVFGYLSHRAGESNQSYAKLLDPQDRDS